MQPHDTTKVCRKCGETKPLTDYTIDTRYKDGHYPWCATCRREWRQGRKDRQRELHASWREQNKEHVQAEARKWYHEHRDQELVKRRARLKERWHYDPAYRARKNREKKERYYTNPEFRTRRGIWSMICRHRRRAANQIAGHFTKEEWRALCGKYGNRCLKCGKQGKLSPDHIIPISKGGSNAIDNIQPLCLPCNLKKNANIADYRPLAQSSFLDGDD